MSMLRVILEGDGALNDRDPEQIIKLDAEALRIACLTGGMESGRPSMGFFICLDDGRTYMIECTMRNFQVAAAMIQARYGLIE